MVHLYCNNRIINIGSIQILERSSCMDFIGVSFKLTINIYNPIPISMCILYSVRNFIIENTIEISIIKIRSIIILIENFNCCHNYISLRKFPSRFQHKIYTVISPSMCFDETNIIHHTGTRAFINRSR